jgi:hypothetical protein
LRKNKFGYLGFLGFLSLLGFFNIWLVFLFGFFGFFGMLKEDERIERNINRACRNAFAFDSIIATLAIAYIALSRTFDAMPLFVALLSQGLTIFGLSCYYYANKVD